jgi:hypothetical protein
VIKEYRCDPDMYVANDGWRAEWHDAISIDLRYVTSAKPYGKPLATIVTLVGQVGGRVIDVEYEVFCRDWQSVKR